MKLLIPGPVMDEIRGHGEKLYPEEGAGLILGSIEGEHREARRVLPMPNHFNSGERNRRYLLDPQEILQAEELAEQLGLEVIDDIWPEERFYFRSDHYNFARRGVPILFFFSGVHPDYHRPSDEPSKLKYEKAARITRLIYLLGLEIANADDRPAWDPEAYRRIVKDAGA